MLSTYFALDYIILYIFLAVTLIIGVWAGRNIRDIRDYALAGKTFGVGALTMTFLATYIGGWHIWGFPSDIANDGIIHLIIEGGLGGVFCLMFIIIFIVPKIKFFKESLTMGELMKIFYGEKGRIIGAILGICYSITAVSIQLTFLKNIASLLDMNDNLVIIVISLITVLYASLGGIKSVTLTDLIQFMIIAVAIPLLANILVYKVGGLKNFLNSIEPDKLTISLFKDKAGSSAKYYSFPILALWFVFPGFPLSPPFIQRMLMAKNQRQLTRLYTISIAFLSFFFIILVIIGFATSSLYPTINKDLLLFKVIKELPIGIKGIVIAGILAIIMSSVDSFLHSAGLLLVNDIVLQLQFFSFYRNKNTLSLIKSLTFLIGCISITLTIVVKDIYKIAIYGMDLTALLITIPLIAGLLRFKTYFSSFLISIITTITAFILTSYFISAELVIPICIATNGITFFTTHIIKNKGFLIIQNDEHKPNTHHLITPRVIIAKLINSIIYLPLRINNHLKEQMNNYELNHSSFGLFMSLTYMIPYFINDIEFINHIFVLKLIGTCLCVGLLLQPYWSNYFYDKFFHLYWNFTLLYCLPFSTSLFYILNNGNTLWAVNLAFSIMLLMALVDWKSFIVMGASGTFIATLYARTNFIIPNLNYSKTYSLLYIVVYSILISYLFFRKKELKFDQILKDNTYLSALSKDLSIHLHKVFLEEKKRQEKEKLEMRYMQLRYMQDVVAMNRVSKEINQTITKVMRKNRRKAIKKLANKMFNNKKML
jgi:Na+/proline symporter